MKYKITFKIETMIDIDNEIDLKEKSWDAINKIFAGAIFGNEGKEEEFIKREKVEK